MSSSVGGSLRKWTDHEGEATEEAGIGRDWSSLLIDYLADAGACLPARSSAGACQGGGRPCSSY